MLLKYARRPKRVARHAAHTALEALALASEGCGCGRFARFRQPEAVAMNCQPQRRSSRLKQARQILPRFLMVWHQHAISLNARDLREVCVATLLSSRCFLRWGVNWGTQLVRGAMTRRTEMSCRAGQSAELTEKSVAMVIPACGTSALTYILQHIEIGERRANGWGKADRGHSS